jgi:integrase
MTEHCLADALGGLLAHSGDEQLQWRGSLTDLMELVGVVARAGLLYNDEGQPLCFAELARLTCRVLHVRLPRRVPHELTIPTPEDVALLIAEADESFRPVLVIASSMGPRRAEISALTWSDVRDGFLRINKAYTKGPDGVLHLRAPKTNAGIRSLPIPPIAAPYLTPPAGADPDDRIVPLTPDAITRRFERLTARLGLPFRFHALRHYYDSVLCSLGVPDKYIMARMGHATPSMTKQVYQHIMAHKDDQITDAINDYFK